MPPREGSFFVYFLCCVTGVDLLFFLVAKRKVALFNKVLELLIPPSFGMGGFDYVIGQLIFATPFFYGFAIECAFYIYKARFEYFIVLCWQVYKQTDTAGEKNIYKNVCTGGTGF